MFSDSLWFLSAVAAPQDGERCLITYADIEELEDTEEVLDDVDYLLLYLFRTVLHFDADGRLYVLIPLDDDELEDPSYRENCTVTEDGCLLAGTHSWEERDGTLYVSRRFLEGMTPPTEEDSDSAAEEMVPLPLSEDGSLTVNDVMIFRPLDPEA